MWTFTRAAAVAVAALALVAVLVVADTQYTMRIVITDPTFRTAAFATALGSFAEHRDSCPLHFLATPAHGTTSSRTVQVVFSIRSGASAACASSLRNIMADQGNNGPSFTSFRTALTTNGVGTLVSITAANPAPPSGGGDDNDQNKLWVFIGAGVVAGIVVIIGVAMLVLRGKERRAALDQDAAQGDHLQPLAGNNDAAASGQPVSDSNGNGEPSGATRTLAQPTPNTEHKPEPQPEPKPEPQPEPKPEPQPEPEPVPVAATEEPAPPVQEAAAAAEPQTPEEVADDVAVEEDEEPQEPATSAASPPAGEEETSGAVAEAAPTDEPGAATTENAPAEEGPATDELKEE